MMLNCCLARLRQPSSNFLPGLRQKPPPRICSSAMTQQVQPAKQCESSPNTKQMKETLSEVKGQHETLTTWKSSRIGSNMEIWSEKGGDVTVI